LGTGWIAAGGVATAAAAILTYWAGNVESKSEAKAIDQKLEEFLRRLKQVTSEPGEHGKSHFETSDSISTIKNDFAMWAEQFAENRHFRELKFKHAKLGRQTLAAVMTSKWRPFLHVILELLRNTAAAYNKRLRSSIKADLPDIPNDLFAHPYRGSVTFAKDLVWRLQTECTHPPRQSSILTLWIYFDKGTRLLPTAAASVVLRLDTREFELFAHGADVPVDIDMVGKPIEEFSAKMSDVIRQLVEAQLLEQEAN
jgi:hypothetical protein